MNNSAKILKMPDRAKQKKNRRQAPKRGIVRRIEALAFGGFVPLAAYTVAHSDWNAGASFRWAEILPSLIERGPLPFIVAGGLLFSSQTVYRWALTRPGATKGKALGFVVLLEGILLFSSSGWLAAAALGLLIAINTLAAERREA